MQPWGLYKICAQDNQHGIKVFFRNSKETELDDWALDIDCWRFNSGYPGWDDDIIFLDYAVSPVIP